MRFRDLEQQEEYCPLDEGVQEKRAAGFKKMMMHPTFKRILGSYRKPKVLMGSGWRRKRIKTAEARMGDELQKIARLNILESLFKSRVAYKTKPPRVLPKGRASMTGLPTMKRPASAAIQKALSSSGLQPKFASMTDELQKIALGPLAVFLGGTALKGAVKYGPKLLMRGGMLGKVLPGAAKATKYMKSPAGKKVMKGVGMAGGAAQTGSMFMGGGGSGGAAMPSTTAGGIKEWY